MLRYKLRTLLIVLALVPPVLAAAIPPVVAWLSPPKPMIEKYGPQRSFNIVVHPIPPNLQPEEKLTPMQEIAEIEWKLRTDRSRKIIRYDPKPE